MNSWLPHPFATVRRLVTVISLTLTLAACSGAGAPIAPSAIQQASSDVSPVSDPAARLATRRAVNTFPLVNGSFTLRLSTSDGSVGTVQGTYTGEAVVSEHGVQTARLELQVTSNDIGLIIPIEAEGKGAFADEGDFSLSLLLTPSLTKSPLRATIRGTSHVSCSASHRIFMALQGTDSTRGFLEITAGLQHEVERTACL